MRTRAAMGIALVGTIVVVALGCRETAPPNAGGGGGGGGGEATGPREDPAHARDATGDLGDGGKKALAFAEQLTAGTPVDLDGDGTPELTETHDGPRLTLRAHRGDDSAPDAYALTWDTSTRTGTERIDADSDGKPEYDATTSGSPRKRVAQLDTDLDGAIDRRVTTTYDDAARTERIVVEVKDGGGWKLTSDGTAKTARDLVNADGFYECGPKPQNPNPPAQGNPDPNCPDPTFCTFPSGTPVLQFGGHKQIGIHASESDQDGADGSCSRSHASTLTRALECAMQRAEDCVAKANEGAGAKLASFIGSGRWELACGNKKKGVGATTDGPAGGCPWWAPTPLCNPSHTNVNPHALDGGNDDETCEVVLHEMMHAAGIPDRDDTDGGGEHDRCGDDEVYNCSRYCGGIKQGSNCNENPHYTPNGVTPGYDCAKCSDTQEKKAACGEKKKAKKVDIEVPLCHHGFASYDCVEPMGVKAFYCDGSLKAPPDSVMCCNKCNDGDEGRMDLKCTADQMKQPDTCGQCAPAPGGG